MHVFSDSVLCLGKLHDHLEAKGKWRDQISEFQRSETRLRIRMPAEQDFEEMVPDVHGLFVVGHAISCTVHSSLFVVALLCFFGKRACCR